MASTHRIARARVREDGTIVLPPDVARELHAAPGDELDVNVEHSAVVLCPAAGSAEAERESLSPEEDVARRRADLERLSELWGNALGGQDPTEFIRELRSEWPD
ncbi:MAG: AbrB/MazE/SpoVT family DNA-binding domain-containing protein [Dehalococcoidia bacterium]|nr:AbrB/MazE/SpoVT family DNA-binding domain-containing protein [Dehalococcoidia bacterium]